MGNLCLELVIKLSFAQVEEKKFFHLRSLIEGAIYRQLGDTQFSEQLFKEAIARHEGKNGAIFNT